MKRMTAGLERAAVLVVGLALVVVGAAAVAWQQDWIPGAVDRIDMSVVSDHTSAGWWPWAVGAAGLLLVIAGISWLTAHARRRTVTHVRLAGAGADGRLTVESSALVDAAAAAFDDVPGLRSRGGRVWRDGRDLVVDLRAAMSPGADLGEVTSAAERAAGTVHEYLGDRTQARFRTVLVSGGRRRGKETRVR